MQQPPDPMQPASVNDDKVILVVDDDHTILRFICSVLCLRGYTRLLAANDSSQALKLADRYSGRIDLLLSDVIMPPGAEGPELAGRLTRRRPGISVLLMSGYSRQSLPMEPGWQFLQKPFKPAELIQSVERALSQAPLIQLAMPA